MWCKKWLWNRLFSKYFDFPLSVCSKNVPYSLIHSLLTLYKLSSLYCCIQHLQNLHVFNSCLFVLTSFSVIIWRIYCTLLQCEYAHCSLSAFFCSLCPLYRWAEHKEKKIVFIMPLVGDICMQYSLSIVCIVVMYLRKPTLSHTVSLACIVQVCTSFNIGGSVDFIIKLQKSSSIKLI